MMTARLEMLAVGLGMSWLGGPHALYDLPDEHQIHALAWGLVVAESPELNPGPIAWNGMVRLWNDAHTSKPNG